MASCLGSTFDLARRGRATGRVPVYHGDFGSSISERTFPVRIAAPVEIAARLKSEQRVPVVGDAEARMLRVRVENGTVDGFAAPFRKGIGKQALDVTLVDR